MSIKSILCVCDGTADEISSLNTALILAKSFTARLRIIHIMYPVATYMQGIISNAEIVAAMNEDNDKRLRTARELTEKYAALHNVPLNVAEAPLRHASAQFISYIDSESEIIAREGRASDLIVVGHSMNGMNITYDSTHLTALFETGRPVLVAPYKKEPLACEWECKTVTLLWDGSLEAARAFYNAMPFIEAAEKVHVLMAQSPAQTHRITDKAPLLEYLNAHGISADVIMIDPGKISEPEALMAEIHSLKTDMVVMGAYGHARAREMILGGVTHYMLKKADMPLLLSH